MCTTHLKKGRTMRDSVVLVVGLARSRMVSVIVAVLPSDAGGSCQLISGMYLSELKIFSRLGEEMFRPLKSEPTAKRPRFWNPEPLPGLLSRVSFVPSF